MTVNRLSMQLIKICPGADSGLTRHSPLLVLLAVLLLAARGTQGQARDISGGSRPSKFSDFFSSVNLLELEDDIVRTEKLLESLIGLQAYGQSIEIPFDLQENVAVTENVFLSAHDFQANKMESRVNFETLPSMFSISTIAARRDALKNFVLRHPFQFIGLLFSDLDEQKMDEQKIDEQKNLGTDSDKKPSVDLTTYLGLRLMFKFVLDIFGADSKIGKFILSVSDALRTIDSVAEPDSAHNNSFDWIGVDDPSSSLVTTKETDSGEVSEVEAKVTIGIIGLMAAVSRNRLLQTPQEKLALVLQHMEYIATVVNEFLWTLKHKVFPAELDYLNNVPQETISSYGNGHQSAQNGPPFPNQDGTLQYPEFYKQFLLGRAPPVMRTSSVGHGLEEKLLPAPAVYKSIRRRDVDVDTATVESPHNGGNKKFSVVFLKELGLLPPNDGRVMNPIEKWNALRKLFHNKNLAESKNHYYNYFVDESSLTDRIKRLTTLLEGRETNSSPTNQEALVITKQAITNLEKLLSDVYDVRKAVIDQDPEGAEDFGEVFYNAETLVDEILEVLQANNFTGRYNNMLDSSSGKILQQVFV